jgi:SWI/SNF-related matrix-associated actin-dependent regulator of chromatin subfamily B protein 1
MRTRYPIDKFQAEMRPYQIDPTTNQPIKADAPPTTGPPKWQFLPRIRCMDCPGKLYAAGPEQTADNFEIHLKNRQHKENVGKRQTS